MSFHFCFMMLHQKQLNITINKDIRMIMNNKKLGGKKVAVAHVTY